MADRLVDDPAGLDEAIRYAKVRAGLDPDQAYPLAQWVEHLEQHWRRPFWESQLDRVVEAEIGYPKHNHFTRDIKAQGKCPACDRHYEAIRVKGTEVRP
jgi:hypothetical protein